MAQGLPTKLTKEPLVEAIFEIRFLSSVNVSDILPGFLHSKVKGAKVERLPLGQLPREFRQNDAQLAQQPVLQIQLPGFLLLVGDKSLAISCLLPYLGWMAFKAEIQKMLSYLKEAEIVEKVERYALKYIDVIEGNSVAETIGRVNLAVSLGNNKLRDSAFQLKFEVARDEFIHVLQLGAPGIVTLVGGQTRQGLVLTVDSISVKNELPLDPTENELFLDRIHQANKEIFFECLTDDAVKFLEPVYE